MLYSASLLCFFAVRGYSTVHQKVFQADPRLASHSAPRQQRGESLGCRRGADEHVVAGAGRSCMAPTPNQVCSRAKAIGGQQRTAMSG
jgi:hypothetical protein